MLFRASFKRGRFDVIAVGHRPSDNGFFADHDIPYFSVDILDESSYSVLPQNDVCGIVHMAAILPAKWKVTILGHM